MKRNLLTVCSAAAATMALVLAMFLPTGLVAVDNLSPAAVAADRPQLKVGDVTLSIKPLADKYTIGDKAALELTAVNAGNEPATLNVDVVLKQMSLTSMASRRASAPQEFWRTTVPITVPAGQSCTFSIAPEAQLPGPGSVQITLAVGKDTLQAASFAVGGKAPTADKGSPAKKAAANAPAVQAQARQQKAAK